MAQESLVALGQVPQEPPGPSEKTKVEVGPLMFTRFVQMPVLLSALLISGSKLLSAQEFPAEDVVRRILAERVALGRNPGIVVGLLDEGGPRVVTAGTAGRQGVELDQATVFEIGSATKVFTAAILQEMVLRGEVHFDDPVSRFLPRHVSVPREPEREITLLDLATHRSGLPRMPLNFFPEDMRNPYANYSVEQLYAFLTEYELPRGIGAQWEYSNLGMGLLGHALALKAGMTYEQLVRTAVLDPLEMMDTGVHLAPPVGAPFAQGHDALGEATQLWDLPTLPGAGALRSTAHDMLLFLAANLEEGDANTAYLRGTHGVRIPGIAPGLSMALGWLVNTRSSDRPITWHNGGTGGFHSFIGLDPLGKRGVVVLSLIHI